MLEVLEAEILSELLDSRDRTLVREARELDLTQYCVVLREVTVQTPFVLRDGMVVERLAEETQGGPAVACLRGDTRLEQ